ncbi:MAG: DUF3822 family protein [Bacteroidales bacterium]|nr:DUF3822 family protein [Bacteroidales bacterium]
MARISVIDETFDSNITSTYHLSIEVGPGHFTFCILDTVRTKFLALKHYPFEKLLSVEELLKEIKTILHTEGYLTRSYKSIYLNYLTKNSVLIPSPLFQPEASALFFKHACSLSDKEEILSQRIPSVDAQVLFTIPSQIRAEIDHTLDEVRFYHQAAPMIEDGWVNVKNQPDTGRCSIQVHENSFDVAVFSGNQFKLFNTYNYNSPEDLVFLVLYLFDQFEFNQEITPLDISGSIDPQGEITRLFHKYIRQVNFLSFNRSYTYSYTFNELEQHRFAPLINSFNCEL